MQKAVISLPDAFTYQSVLRAANDFDNGLAGCE
jgi:hypothetical protein